MTNKERIEGALKDNPQGLTIQELSNKAIMSRATISIALAELKGEGKIEIRNVGMAKIHYWKTK